MNRDGMKRNIIALLCAAIMAVALLLPMGLQGQIAPSKPVSEVTIGQAGNPDITDDQGESPDGDEAPTVASIAEGDTQSGGAPPDEPEYVSGEILVGLADDVTADQLNERLTSLDYVATRYVSDDEITFGYVKLELAEGVTVEDAAARIEDEPLVGAAQPNYIYHMQDESPDDAAYSAESLQIAQVEEGVLDGQNTVIDDPKKSSQWALEAVRAYEAWDTVRVNGAVTVAVLDSGVNGGHEDLDGRVLPGYNAIENNTDVTDNYGHGTHVAGIIAATANNNTGVAGVSYNASIYPVKVMDSKETDTGKLLAGMNKVADPDNGVNPKVMNVSIGSSDPWTGSDAALQAAVTKVHNKGILIVYAAANKTSGSASAAWDSYPVDLDLNSAGTEGHPSSIGVINAQKSGNTYARTPSSNYNKSGKKTKTLCAPGTNIYSTLRGGGYGNMSGTSMAAPYVSGIAALVFAANPALSASQVKKILEETAQDLGPKGWDNETGYGMVDAAAAVQKAAKQSGGVGTAPTIGGDTSVKATETAQVSIANSGSRTWTWMSSDDTLAVVNGAGTAATVTGVKQGDVVVIARSNDDIELRHKITVTTSLAAADVQVKETPTYDGTPKKPVPTVTLNGTTLEQGKDYKVSYSNNVNATTGSSLAQVIITGTGHYTGEVSGEFSIAKATITKAELSQSTYKYNGSPCSPTVTVYGPKNGNSMVKLASSDYSVQIPTNRITPGEYRYKISGYGNYTGDLEAVLTVTKGTLGSITVQPSSYTYDGNAKTPTVVVKDTNGRVLTKNTDYTLTGPTSCTNVGTYTYTAKPKGNYEGSSKSATVTINKASLKNATVTLSQYNCPYTGSAQTPTAVVKVGGKQLDKGSDYSISYSNNVNIGTATVRITPGSSGNYKDSYTTSFNIVMSSADNSKAHQVQYNTHVQNVGWQSYVRDGAIAGSSGRSLRLEGIHISLVDHPYSGSIEYRTHIQNIGWESGWKSNGDMSGTSGRSLRLEAIQIRLTGNAATQYDVYYRVHTQNIGWMGWAKNGAPAGTAGYSYRLEGIQIRLVPKGDSAPGSTADAYRQR